jgi:hypothetical protein
MQVPELVPAPVESSGEKFGRLAFAYCKIATVSLILGRFALPVACALSAGFFIAGWIKGKTDTKCVLKYPLPIAALWLTVLALWLALEFAPASMPAWLDWLHR